MKKVSSHDRKGKATGRLIGGNLGVISILGGTTYDMVSRYLRPSEGEEGVILFFEASGIPLGKVRDMLITLYLSGTFLLVKGIILGSFRDCEPTGNLHSIRDVVKELEERLIISPEIPIVFDFPFGAGTPNLPFIVGQKIDLEVDEELISLRSSQS